MPPSKTPTFIVERVVVPGGFGAGGGFGTGSAAALSGADPLGTPGAGMDEYAADVHDH